MFGVIGWVDDYKKLIHKDPKGLRAKHKYFWLHRRDGVPHRLSREGHRAARVVFAEQSKQTAASPNITPSLLLVLAVAVVGHLMTHKAYDGVVGLFQKRPMVVRALLLVGLALFIEQVASFEVQPFIYFNF